MADASPAPTPGRRKVSTVMVGMEERQELRDVNLFVAAAELVNRRLGLAGSC
jgi:hypothetical protein